MFTRRKTPKGQVGKKMINVANVQHDTKIYKIQAKERLHSTHLAYFPSPWPLLDGIIFYMIIISLLLKGLDLVHFNQFNHFNYSVKESKGKTLRKSSEAQQVVVGRLSNTADRLNWPMKKGRFDVWGELSSRPVDGCLLQTCSQGTDKHSRHTERKIF